MEKKKNYLLLVLRGCAMGAADVIPGVSGGTIAFITGIYEELINSIRSIDLQALRLLGTFKFKEFWKHINGNFLVSVVAGIAISIFSLAKLMKYLLEFHPLYIWSFFFGLIIASALLVSKEVKKWDLFTITSLVVGAVVGYTITVLTPTSTPETWWFVLLSGAIAICAMILPGISGAFILLLLGKYEYIITAVSDFNIGILLVFLVGAVAGIISFSHLLSWLLKNYHGMTVALLTGFMVGSLNKIWPWKLTDTELINGTSFEIERNVLPGTFEQAGNDPLTWHVLLMCLIGFLLIWGIERLAVTLKK
ncbi:DUF368 domain-containing protein [Butyricimonas sp. Marseille-P3923]|uniref:DUF368 domain-containing protein n=1 Tax=Butyricimonas sp. Marseille-P3923 TaxID=1987504 RepID=UPI000C08BA9E|nr:DUF368 domain-containing protein [Butyricimonas sp. Marseille-P3923]